VDLTVTQVQAELPFENVFRLPVDVEIVTASGRTAHTVELTGWTTHASFDVEGGPPLAVTFDRGGFLVAEVSHQRSLREVLYQLESGGLAEQLRAARQIATDFPRRPASLPALARVLEDENAHWGLRQEAARGLGSIGGPQAVAALATAISDSDRRVRRAAALGLAQAGGETAARALRGAIESDDAEDVVGVAAAGLGSIHAEGAREFLEAQLERKSRWYHAVRLGALLGLAELEDPELVPVFGRFTGPSYPTPVRLAAVDGWSRAGAAGATLAARLRELAYDRTLYVRLDAIEKLGALHRAEDLPFLEKLATEDPDTSLAQVAREAAKEIEAFRAP
jgi:HEAT repeat protein